MSTAYILICTHTHTHIHTSVTHTALRGNTHKHTPCRESYWDSHTPTHTLGFHICVLSLPPSLSRSCRGHTRLQSVATVTLCDVTSEWKEVPACACVCVCECLHNTEARDETPCMSDHGGSWRVWKWWDRSGRQVKCQVFTFWVLHHLFLAHFNVIAKC